MKIDREPGPSRSLAAKVMFAALAVLKENSGELPSAKVMELVGGRVKLDEWARARYEKSGYVRWESILHFYSVGCVKAGFLVKKKGVWFLTPEGEEALKLGETGLLKAIDEGYREWATTRTKVGAPELPAEPDEETVERAPELSVDQFEALAIEGLKNHINSKNPYEFQDLAAALLRGMGYFTPFVAPRGKDGGVDIVCYKDPLGTTTPRIKVQIKHRESSASVQEVRQLIGVLSKDGEVGIFISTGGFTPDAKAAARGSHVHVELIDLERFVELWQDFYSKLSDEDKSLMPLLPINFLAPPA